MLNSHSSLRTLSKHATGLVLTPIAAVGGVLYAASVLAPLSNGLRKNLADHSAARHRVNLHRLESLAHDEACELTAYPQSSSTLGSVLKEFAAPLTWAVQGYRAGYSFIQ